MQKLIITTKIQTTALLYNHTERIEHIKKLDTHITTNIVEFVNTDKKYNYFYELIEGKWKAIIQIKLAGIDDFHRAVFKDVNSANYYGDCNSRMTGKPETVIAYYKKNIDQLEYFGRHWNCEPDGGLNPNYKLEIID